MASPAEMRRKIKNLQRQLDDVVKNNNELRQKLQQNNGAEIRKLRAEYDALIKRKEKEAEHEYIKRVRAYEEEINRKQKEYIKQIQEADKAAQEQRNKILEEIKKSNDELEKEIQEIKKRDYKEKENNKKAAMDIKAEANAAEQKLDLEPHEFFFPDELGIIQSHMGKINDMINHGMYAAAAAIADAALTEIELLSIKVENKKQEWLKMYEDYRKIIVEMREKIKDFEKEVLETKSGKFTLKDSERDFWSEWLYLKVKEIVDQSHEMIEEIDKIGVNKYLKQGKASQGYQFIKAINNANKLSDQITAIIVCIRNERYYSDYRFELGESIADMFEVEGYEITRDCFRLDENEEENPTDSFDIIAKVSDEATIYVTLFPVRENGVVIRNECLMSVDSPYEVTHVMVTEIIEKIFNIIRKCDIDMSSNKLPQVAIHSSAGDRKKILSDEAVVKKEFSPEKLIKSYEKKYN